jgi:hypothetical protein
LEIELGIEDKIEELDNSDKEKILRKYKGNMQDCCDTIKTQNLGIMCIKEEELKAYISYSIR